MQLTIDTHTETPRALRVYSEILTTLAKLAADEIADAATPQQELDWKRGNVTPAPHNGILGAAPFTMPAQRMEWPDGIKEGVIPIAPPPPPAPVSNVVPFVPVTTVGNAPSAVPAAAAADNQTTVASYTIGPDGKPAGHDNTGLPWDERIHSAGANPLNSDGTWRQKRGANPMLVASVTAELRARQQAPVPPPAVPAAMVPLPLPVPPPPPAALPVELPPAAVLPLPAAPAVGTVSVTFTQLIMQANRYATEGRYDMERLSAAVVRAGGSDLGSLAANPALVAATWAIMEEAVRA